ncbi:hypothetical protein GIS00_04440 [Nakamurella sp. YIM 132087]|uniref:Small CPxCG-related zinc finger protein n=1 Tax=Nakamurella alba TaxID=2665158 RepID=A0A7K1FGE4_9ACTN|nr:hypothetical protein [Nakamurella alba]MTD13195.1 hypothetical protein [Nakamurella alba]
MERVPEDTVTCTMCGTVAAATPLDWVSERGPRGLTWVCAVCARTHLRAIEAKLDQEWW